MIRFKLFSLLILSLLVLTHCNEDEPVTPVADFTIEKDAIIDGKKTRIEVDKVSVNDVVYFVSKGNGMFNSIWPGDSLKTGNITVFHDYNMKKDMVNIAPFSKADTTNVMKSTSYQGIPLPMGTLELSYTYKLKGTFTVTLIATNSSVESSISEIRQRSITVE
jgi:hypothetical protein